MSILLFNPRSILRSGSKAMLEAAANKENIVLFRAGALKVMDKMVIRGAHGHATNTYGEELMDKVFKLVECTPEEIVAYQKQLNNEVNQEAPES